MPIYKFKTHEEAQQALWNFNPDQDYYRKIRELFQLALRLSPPRCKGGIRTYKTIEEASEATAAFRGRE